MGDQDAELYGDELGMGGSYDDGQEIPVGSNGGDESMGVQQEEVSTYDGHVSTERARKHAHAILMFVLHCENTNMQAAMYCIHLRHGLD
jgi:hypothetical protein